MGFHLIEKLHDAKNGLLSLNKEEVVKDVMTLTNVSLGTFIEQRVKYTTIVLPRDLDEPKMVMHTKKVYQSGCFHVKYKRVLNLVSK